MKKTVYVCTCDVCKKVIEDESRRFIIKLGVGNWNQHDSFEEKLDKDLCLDCYTSFFDLAEGTQTTNEEREFTAKIIKKSMSERDEKIWELHERGVDYKDIAKQFGITPNAVSIALTRYRKQHNIPLLRTVKK